VSQLITVYVIYFISVYFALMLLISAHTKIVLPAPLGGRMVHHVPGGHIQLLQNSFINFVFPLIMQIIPVVQFHICDKGHLDLLFLYVHLREVV
jgi:hypothetical protein